MSGEDKAIRMVVRVEKSDVVYKCHTCTHGGHKKREPLITSEYPSRPWEIVSADLFDFKDIFAGGRLLLFKICQNC